MEDVLQSGNLHCAELLTTATVEGPCQLLRRCSEGQQDQFVFRNSCACHVFHMM